MRLPQCKTGGNLGKRGIVPHGLGAALQNLAEILVRERWQAALVAAGISRGPFLSGAGTGPAIADLPLRADPRNAGDAVSPDHAKRDALFVGW